MSPALHAFFAQTAPEAQSANPIGSFLVPMIAIFAVFYFIMFRPQQKQAKQHQAYLAALKKGDEVVTQGGIVGTVSAVEDRTVSLDVGGGNKLRIVKAQIAGQWKPVESTATEAKK